MSETQTPERAVSPAAAESTGKETQVYDLRKKKTRKALETAFFELSETKWLEDITVGDICEKAMVRRATFYKHFSDKYDFFAYVMNNIQRDTNLLYQADPRNITMAEYCLNICRAYIRNFQQHPKMVKRLINSKSRQPYTDILTSQIREAIRTKEKYDREKGIRTVINVDILSSFISGAIPTVMTMYETGHIADLSMDEYIDQLSVIFERLCATCPID